MISLIAAIGKNNELGKNNKLVFQLPADMKRFKEKTSSHSIIMGRKTFESLGRPLPNRRNIIITRDKNYAVKDAEVVNSLEEAIEKTTGEAEVYIIGGGEIFNEAIKIADRLDITHVEAQDKDADIFFPEIIPIVWNEVVHEEHQKDEKNPYNYTFSVYDRF